ncbi:hypothetical protein [Nereida sp. MMG025]|uniref:hypothetical protein n=1 Tax=Nereida sp. MMG025 TaxID=2909981 RepID=UPI001F38A18D|nr:hypothetical protein [Nereida sp. MMG025]MCF6443435.1 hypothetical protein [Nereida sp. MMG025]
MNTLQAAGLVGAGVAFGLGSAFLMGGGETQAPQQQAEMATQAAETQDAAEVTRQAADPLTLNTISKLNAVVSKAQTPLTRTEDLTDEQLEVIAFFERTAREMNESGQARGGQALRFNNMTIDRLNVRYYYTVGQTFDRISPAAVMAEQDALVHEQICNDASIQTLMRDYGFEYTYRYASQDFRFVGEVKGDLAKCEA